MVLPGFEPGLLESKSRVLTLHHRTLQMFRNYCLCYGCRFVCYTVAVFGITLRVFLLSQKLFFLLVAFAIFRVCFCRRIRCFLSPLFFQFCNGIALATFTFALFALASFLLAVNLIWCLRFHALCNALAFFIVTFLLVVVFLR